MLVERNATMGFNVVHKPGNSWLITNNGVLTFNTLSIVFGFFEKINLIHHEIPLTEMINGNR